MDLAEKFEKNQVGSLKNKLIQLKVLYIPS